MGQDNNILPDEKVDSMLNRLNTENGTNFEFTNHMVKMTKPNYYLRNLEIENTSQKDSV